MVMKLVTQAVLLSTLVLPLSAQVLIEAGALTGATATAAGAGGKGVGKGLTNVFGNVQQTLKGAAGTPATAAAAPASQKPVEPPVIVKLPDVTQIAQGMTREDLLAKFGAPSQKMTIPEGSRMIERYRYDVDKETVRIVLEDGKVKEVTAIHPEPVPVKAPVPTSN